MKKILRKDILEILKQEECAVKFSELYKTLTKEYLYDQEFDENKNIFGGKIEHILQVLESDDLIKIRKGNIAGGGIVDFCELTQKGYERFAPWYKKAWKFINDDFAKLLSLTSLILSIIATIISLSK